MRWTLLLLVLLLAPNRIDAKAPSGPIGRQQERYAWVIVSLQKAGLEGEWKIRAILIRR